jgi:diacylglycerol kinase family enzyme
LDGEALEAPLYWLLLGNTRSYGGVIDIASHARADDGLLEAYLFAGEGVSWALANAARIALRRHEGAAGVSYRRVREVAVETAGIPVQLDGEDFGVTPAAFGVRPAALPILVPRGGADRLVGSA